MILEHHCKECGFTGEVDTSGRKVTCPECHTTNDFWLEGEVPPEHHRDDESRIL